MLDTYFHSQLSPTQETDSPEILNTPGYQTEQETTFQPQVRQTREIRSPEMLSNRGYQAGKEPQYINLDDMNTNHFLKTSKKMH